MSGSVGQPNKEENFMRDITPVAKASVTLFERYSAVLKPLPEFDSTVDGCSREHLLWMCQTAIENATSWPVDKLSRWLGFVQGVLTLRGLLTVDGEREFSRPLFHAAYADQGQEAPASVGRERHHNTMELSADDVHRAYGVLMDSALQEELMNTPGHEDAWALDYVYDSSLRAQLDARAAMLGLTV